MSCCSGLVTKEQCPPLVVWEEALGLDKFLLGPRPGLGPPRQGCAASAQPGATSIELTDTQASLLP